MTETVVQEKQVLEEKVNPSVTSGLEDLVHSKLQSFIDQIQGYDVSDLYPIILERVERPLIQLVLRKTRGNQVKAAAMLGINRNTLRKKINHLKIKIKKPYIE